MFRTSWARLWLYSGLQRTAADGYTGLHRDTCCDVKLFCIQYNLINVTWYQSHCWHAGAVPNDLPGLSEAVYRPCGMLVHFTVPSHCHLCTSLHHTSEWSASATAMACILCAHYACQPHATETSHLHRDAAWSSASADDFHHKGNLVWSIESALLNQAQHTAYTVCFVHVSLFLVQHTAAAQTLHPMAGRSKQTLPIWPSSQPHATSTLYIVSAVCQSAPSYE